MDAPKIKNMEEFAAVSGISRPTLSKYFNDPGSVRKSTRSKIESALAQFDYRPNMYAMNQNRRLTKNIGIMVPYLADPFFAEMARTIEDHVLAAGYRPVVLGSHGSSEQEIENLQNLRTIKPAGVLLAPLGRGSDKGAIRAFSGDVPTVLFDSQLEDIGEAFIGHNNEQATAMICEYLVRTGEPPVFFGMKTPTNPNAQRRRNTYCATMEALGCTPHLIQVEGESWDFEEIGFLEGGRVLQGRDLPSNTVLCSNDRLAIGFLSAAYEKGIRVGITDDCTLRVAGHDDHPFSRFTCPKLTTIAQNYAAIAEKSVETLLSRIQTGRAVDSRKETFFEGRLVMRASA